jgi:hypothetical protein
MKAAAGVVFLLAISGVAQTSRPIQIGDSRAEVLRSQGLPSLIYAPDVQKYYPLSHRNSVLEVMGRAEDVFEKTFSGVKFEVMADYSLDTSVSRLHPVERVSQIEFTPDKKLPFWKLIGLLPQAKPLCAKGCSMLGNVLYDVYVYPETVSEDQRALAQRAANGFGPVLDREHAFEFVPCITVTFQESNANYQAPLPDFNSLTVDEITLGSCDPVFEKDSIGGFKELHHVIVP